MVILTQNKHNKRLLLTGFYFGQKHGLHKNRQKSQALYDGRTKSTYEPKRKVRYGLKKLVSFHIRKNKPYTKLTG
jgi:hypothetical protein